MSCLVLWWEILWHAEVETSKVACADRRHTVQGGSLRSCAPLWAPLCCTHTGGWIYGARHIRTTRYSAWQGTVYLMLLGQKKSNFFCIDDPKNSNSGCAVNWLFGRKTEIFYQSNLQSDFKKKRIKKTTCILHMIFTRSTEDSHESAHAILTSKNQIINSTLITFDKQIAWR